MKTHYNSTVGQPIGRLDGFTIVDLVVVIATLGILVTLVLPALAGTKTESTTFQCENNMKQLAMAWTMYSTEGNDLLCNLSTYEASFSPDVANYKYGVPWRTSISCLIYTPAQLTNIIGLTARHKWLTELGFTRPSPTIEGPLYRFCKNVDAQHCPADWRSRQTDSAGYGGPYCWDSYSGSGNLNGESRGAGSGVFGGSASYVIYKHSAITRPSDKFIWTEAADNRGENLGSWWMNNYGTPVAGGQIKWTTAAFADSPAAFHVGASIFNFCDGHVEIHKWQDPRTVAYANDTSPNKDSGSSPVDTAGRLPGNLDAIWAAQHYAGLQNP